MDGVAFKQVVIDGAVMALSTDCVLGVAIPQDNISVTAHRQCALRGYMPKSLAGLLAVNSTKRLGVIRPLRTPASHNM